MNESGTEAKGHGTLIALLILLAAYIFFPIVFAFPLEALNRSGALPKRIYEATAVVFYPLGKLAEVSPPYLKLIEQEMRFAERFLPPEK